MPAESVAGSAPFSDSRGDRDKFAIDVGERSTAGKGAPAAGLFPTTRAAAPHHASSSETRHELQDDDTVTINGVKYSFSHSSADHNDKRIMVEATAEIIDKSRVISYKDLCEGDLSSASLNSMRRYAQQIANKHGGELVSYTHSIDHGGKRIDHMATGFSITDLEVSNKQKTTWKIHVSINRECLKKAFYFLMNGGLLNNFESLKFATLNNNDTYDTEEALTTEPGKEITIYVHGNERGEVDLAKLQGYLQKIEDLFTRYDIKPGPYPVEINSKADRKIDGSDYFYYRSTYAKVTDKVEEDIGFIKGQDTVTGASYYTGFDQTLILQSDFDKVDSGYRHNPLQGFNPDILRGLSIVNNRSRASVTSEQSIPPLQSAAAAAPPKRHPLSSQHTIKKETPHLFMWFTDGDQMLPESPPLPKNDKFDYAARLKTECDKLKETNTPVYLVYMGRLLAADQKQQMEGLVTENDNLFVIDYDEFEQSLPEDGKVAALKEKVAQYCKAYKEQHKKGTGVGGVADLVDFTRLALIYYSDKLRELSNKKYGKTFSQEGIIYRDFDVSLADAKMSDLSAPNEYLTSININTVVREQMKKMTDAAGGDQVKIGEIHEFFARNIQNPGQYKKNVELFTKDSLSDEEEVQKSELESEFKLLGGDNFAFTFVTEIRIENSVIAVSVDRQSQVGEALNTVSSDRDSSPYAAVQSKLKMERRVSRGTEHKVAIIKNAIENIHDHFTVGNDLTWQMTTEEVYSGRGGGTTSSVGAAAPPPAEPPSDATDSKGHDFSSDVDDWESEGEGEGEDDVEMVSIGGVQKKVSELTEEEQLALALTKSMTESNLPTGEGGGSVALLQENAQILVNNAIEQIKYLMTTPKTEPDSNSLASLEMELQERVVNLNDKIRNFFGVAPVGSEVSLNLGEVGIRREIALDPTRGVLVTDRPLIETLRRTLHKTYVAEYRGGQQYQNRFLALKSQSLLAFTNGESLPLLAPAPETDFSQPLSADQIAQSQEIVDIMNYEAQEHVAALQIGIEENFNNPKPTTPYRGVGLNVNPVADKSGLMIREIFSADNRRFKISADQVEDMNPPESDVLDAMQGAKITAVEINGDMVPISTLLGQGEEGKKQIAAAFHAEGEVQFEIEKGEVKSTVTCDNSKNKTAIFCPADPAEIAPPGSSKPTFRALSQGLNEGHSQHYSKTCDQVIKRGKWFTNYEYQDKDILHAFEEEIKEVSQVVRTEKEVVVDGMVIDPTVTYKMQNDKGTKLVIFPSTTLLSEIGEDEDIAEYYKSLIQSAKDSIDGEVKYPLQILFPVNDFASHHWALGEIYIDPLKNIGELVMNDPLIVRNTFNERSEEAINHSLENIFGTVLSLKIHHQSNLKARQEDNKSCGHVVAREAKRFFCGEQDQLEYHGPCAPELRIQDLKNRVVTANEVGLPEVSVSPASSPARPSSPGSLVLGSSRGVPNISS